MNSIILQNGEQTNFTFKSSADYLKINRLQFIISESDEDWHKILIKAFPTLTVVLTNTSTGYKASQIYPLLAYITAYHKHPIIESDSFIIKSEPDESFITYGIFDSVEIKFEYKSEQFENNISLDVSYLIHENKGVIWTNTFELCIKGNIFPLGSNFVYNQEEIFVKGNISLDYNKSLFYFFSNEKNIAQLPANKVFGELIEEIRGCEYHKVFPILNKYKFSIDAHNKGRNGFSIERVALYKSLFNVLLWIEPILISPEIGLANNIYDEFVLDINYKPTSQEFIYFVPRSFVNNNQVSLDSLVEKGLLYSLDVILSGNSMKTYFTPLFIHNEVVKRTIGSINNANDKKVWNNIINAQTIKFRNSFPNR